MRVASPLSPWTARALEILADGAWHPIAVVIDAAAKTVPPGRAFRMAEYQRNQPARRPDGPGARVRGGRDTSIRTGAHETARKAVLDLRRRGRIERDGDRIRLTPKERT